MQATLAICIALFKTSDVTVAAAVFDAWIPAFGMLQNSTLQKEDSPSHQNTGICIEY
jgi:hypothetical protein